MRSFDELLGEEVRRARLSPRALPPGECQTPSGRRCPICLAGSLPYEDEAPLKEQALRHFWKQALPDRPLEGLVLSPKGRGYRTVSKRKVFRGRGVVQLGLIDPLEQRGNIPVESCAIEAPGHGAIYSQVSRFLCSGRGNKLSQGLRYAIIKGTYEEFTLLLTVGRLTGEVFREANALSRAVTASSQSVTGVFLLEDTSTDDRYYMGTGDRQGGARKVFGSSAVFQRVANRPFFFPPFGFSQVNGSILEDLVQGVSALLKPDSGQTLFDLYCGYGLFALSFAPRFARVIGVELSPDSIRSAVENATRQKVRNARFIRADITGESAARVVRQAERNFVVLLDPPRGGTAPGVIEALAGKRPERVVHLVCNIDILPREVHRWETEGYVATKAIPYDLFPGTSSLEIAVLLEGKKTDSAPGPTGA